MDYKIKLFFISLFSILLLIPASSFFIVKGSAQEKEYYSNDLYIDNEEEYFKNLENLDSYKNDNYDPFSSDSYDFNYKKIDHSYLLVLKVVYW